MHPVHFYNTLKTFWSPYVDEITWKSNQGNAHKISGNSTGREVRVSVVLG